MKLEIICPKGLARGTKVFADGCEMTGIKRLVIDIAAASNEPVSVTIERHLLDGKRFLLDPATREPISETLKFTGENFVLAESEFVPKTPETFD